MTQSTQLSKLADQAAVRSPYGIWTPPAPRPPGPPARPRTAGPGPDPAGASVQYTRFYTKTSRGPG
eukprot:12935-Hanusia_phi.AAC.1